VELVGLGDRGRAVELSSEASDSPVLWALIVGLMPLKLSRVVGMAPIQSPMLFMIIATWNVRLRTFPCKNNRRIVRLKEYKRRWGEILI
jgi:hypothetical protein